MVMTFHFYFSITARSLLESWDPSLSQEIVGKQSFCFQKNEFSFVYYSMENVSRIQKECNPKTTDDTT